jgi:hypothetical protein
VLAAAEVCHAIERDAEGNVTRVGEVFVTLGLAIDHDLLLEETLIDGGIEYVPDNVVIAAGAGVGISVLQLFCDGLIPQHRSELVLHRQVLKLFDRGSGALVPGSFAIGAGIEVGVGSGEAAATTGTAIDPPWFQP